MWGQTSALGRRIPFGDGLMKIALVLGFVVVLVATSFACGGDDTLRFFLSKSDLVVFGEITSEPAQASEEVGVVYYFCDFTITEVLKSNQPIGIADPIHVNIVRLEREQGDRAPELKKGCVAILFLKTVGDDKNPRWETSDVWFGFQRATPGMRDALRRVVKDEDAAFKSVEKTKAWMGVLDDKKLTELAPAKGYVTSQEKWKVLWESWRPGRALPKVNFEKQLVLVSAVGPYPVEYDLRLSQEGDLRIVISPRHPGKRGYGYGIVLIERSDVKTIDGKAIELD
jgi:hypothetical protein